MASPVAGEALTDGPERFRLLAVPWWVWGLALLAALLHMTPYAVMAWRTPDGYTFTGNLTVSPDYLQYRVWERQTQEEGPVVSDRFTHEPNRPFLPVPFYWAVGRLASWTGLTPEWTYAWAGVPLAIVLVLLLWALVLRYLRSPPARAWTMATLVFGGGLGALLVVIRRIPALTRRYPVDLFIVRPMEGPDRVAPFEMYRGNYVFQALLDTHFLAFWVATTAAVLALLLVVERPRWHRVAALALLYAAVSLLHVYEGMTLMAITVGVLGFAMLRGVPLRTAAAIVAATGLGVTAALAWALGLQRASGLPTPDWRGLTVPPGIVLLAYPVAWLLLAIGGIRYWREADRSRAMLVGWAAGCLAMVLSGPFFPWPDRGTITLQLPLLLIAALIYFRDRARVPIGHATLLVLLAGPSLALRIHDIARARFDPTFAHIWVTPAHQRVVSALHQASTPDDLLLADEVTRRWLVPEYRGRLWAGHFFLTVDYADREAEVESFLASRDTSAQGAFLRRTGATRVFVPANRDPAWFRRLPMLREMAREEIGTLFAVTPGASIGNGGAT